MSTTNNAGLLPRLLELRAAGVSWRAIGRKLEINHKTAQRLWLAATGREEGKGNRRGSKLIQVDPAAAKLAYRLYRNGGLTMEQAARGACIPLILFSRLLQIHAIRRRSQRPQDWRTGNPTVTGRHVAGRSNQ